MKRATIIVTAIALLPGCAAGYGALAGAGTLGVTGGILAAAGGRGDDAGRIMAEAALLGALAGAVSGAVVESVLEGKAPRAPDCREEVYEAIDRERRRYPAPAPTSPFRPDDGAGSSYPAR